MSNRTKAFTLTEVIVVVVTVAIIAAFGIPNYIKAIEKADERNMIANLAVMRAAVDMYTLKGDAIGTWNGLGAVNANLGLSVVDPRANYSCGTVGTNGCRATHHSGAWALEFHDEHSGGLIHCGGGTCPSCPNQPGNCG